MDLEVLLVLFSDLESFFGLELGLDTWEACLGCIKECYMLVK